jgi:hypothetical protein
MDRGDRREDIFINDVDRQDFLKTLTASRQRRRRGGSGGDSSDIGVTCCKQGGSGSSDRICPPIQGERENRDGANGSRAIFCRGIYEVRLLEQFFRLNGQSGAGPGSSPLEAKKGG